MIAAQVPEGIVQIVEFNLHFGNAGAVCNAVSAHTFDPFFFEGLLLVKLVNGRGELTRLSFENGKSDEAALTGEQ